MIAVPTATSLATEFVQPHEVRLEITKTHTECSLLQVGKVLVGLTLMGNLASLGDQFIFQEIYKVSLYWWPELVFLIIAILNCINIGVVIVLHFLMRKRTRKANMNEVSLTEDSSADRGKSDFVHF